MAIKSGSKPKWGPGPDRKPKHFRSLMIRRKLVAISSLRLLRLGLFFSSTLLYGHIEVVTNE
jgi:hypothetical protein